MIGLALGVGRQRFGGGGGVDPDAAAFITAAGITGATETAAVSTLVTSLKGYGIWSKMKAVYPFVTDNRNLLGYTEDFSNAYWSVGSGALKTPNYATAPDGTTTACRVYNGGFFQSGGISKQVGTYIFSFYAKTTSGNTSTIRVFLDGGTITTTKTINATWTRIETTQTFASTNNGTCGFFPDSSDILIWHPQLELGSTATTYQPILTTQQAFIANQFKYNLVNPVDSDAAFRLVFNGGWTHSANGATPNGTNGYADTKLSPSSVLAQNSTHASFYSRTNISTANQIDFGASAALTKCYAYLNDGGLTYFRINHFTTESSTSVGGSSQKNYIFNRTNSTTESVFLNSTKTSFTKASNGIPNVNMYLGATNNQGSAALFASKQCAMFTIGDGLTDTEAANFYTAVQAYQTALSRQV